MTIRHALATATLLAATAAAFPAHALTISASNYCSAGSDPTRNGDTASPNYMSIYDVSFTIDTTVYRASDCYGRYSPGSGVATEVAELNQIWGGPTLAYLDKSDNGGARGPGLGGVTFQVAASQTRAGWWTLTWQEAPGTPNLPLYADLAILLKGSTFGATYLLRDVLLPTSPNTGSGAFDIQFRNASGRNEPTLSHLTVAGRMVRPAEVPEPASLALLGAGLVGLGLVQRRRRRR